MTLEQQTWMAEAMDKCFRFKIGDHVASARQYPIIGQTRAKSGEAASVLTPDPWLVTDRWVEQCPGGIQLAYSLDDGSGNLVRLREHSLVPFEASHAKAEAALEDLETWRITLNDVAKVAKDMPTAPE